MSAQGEYQWKVLDTGVSSNRRSERAKRKKGSSEEEVKNVDEVKKEKELNESNKGLIERSEVDVGTTKVESSDAIISSTNSNSRKSRVALNRRKQVPSKRALRKAGELNTDEHTKANADVILQNINAVNNNTLSTEQSAIPSETNSVAIATATTTATPANANAATVDKSDNSNTTSTATVNVWEARRQQKELQNKKSDASNTLPTFQSNSLITSSSTYRPPKLLASTVQPVKRGNVDTVKAVNKEQDIVVNSAPATNLLRQGPSGYRPPHQRGDAPMVKLPDNEEYSSKERTGKGNYRDREAPLTKIGADDRMLSREAMGKGRPSYRQFGKEEDDKRSSDKKLGESLRDFGNGAQKKGYSGNRRKDNSWDHANGSEPVKADDSHGVHSVGLLHKRDTNLAKRDTNNGFASKNSAVRSQSLKNESRLPKAMAERTGNVMTKTYSAPKEQLVQVVKLQGSIEHKEEKIMKIKQQMKEKVKTQNVTGLVGGFQPILSSAEDALRATFDGNEDITRENAELVRQELKTNLNPLNPEFAPQQHIPDVNTSFDNAQFAMDQSGDTIEQGQNMGMYSTYDTQLHNELEPMQDANMHLSWSFHPSDQSVYAQDMGGDMDYDMSHHYSTFGTDGIVGGPNHGTANGTQGSGNTPAGGPPSQSPEHEPASHTLNEAFNTQSTATMAATQPFVPNAAPDAQVNSQMPSDGQPNGQMFAPNDYTIQNGGDGLNYAAQPFYPPQGPMDINAMWGPMDNAQGYYGWPVMQPPQQQNPGHKSQHNKQRNLSLRQKKISP